MRGFLVFTIMLVSICSAAVAGPKEEALLVVGKWTKAFTESDVDGIVKLYAPDALFLGTGSKTIVTKPEGIRTYFEAALLSNRPRGATVGESSVSVLSDKAVVIVGMDTVTGTKDGAIYSANGRVTFVVEKREAGWQIVHFHRSAMPS
jgi:uncharacterized protein (TIGR02246 family)